jgi:hypothetical protein
LLGLPARGFSGGDASEHTAQEEATVAIGGSKRRTTRLVAAAGCAVVLSLLAAVGATRASGESPAKADRIRATEQARLDALVHADTRTAGRFMAEDFEVINPAGGVLTRDEYLGAVDGGDIDYLAFRPTSPIDVRLHGDAAVLRFQVHFDLVVGGELHVTHEGWLTELYELRQGEWQAVWEQATAVPNDFDAFVQAILPPS